MGEAKKRGTFEHRKSKALERRPDFIICNNCKSKITNLTFEDTRGIPGLDIVCAGKCETCNHVTWGVNGEPESCQMFLDFLNETQNKENLMQIQDFRNLKH